MSTKKEEELVTELVNDIYEIFDKSFYIYQDFPPTPVIFSRIIKFIREFTNNPDFILGVESGISINSKNK